MTNFEKYKQNLTLDNLLHPGSVCDYCTRDAAKCRNDDGAVCMRHFREYMEAEAAEAAEAEA